MSPSGEVVLEEEVVVRSTIGGWVDLSAQIAVDESEVVGGSCCRLVRWLPVLFSFQTWFAYSHCRPGFYSHSIDHFCQLSDVVLADMCHSSMPKVDVEFARWFRDFSNGIERVVSGLGV